MKTTVRDPLVKVIPLSAITNPQEVAYLAMHQDYSSKPVYESVGKKHESECGRIVVDKCLKFGHFGVIEHPQIVMNACYFPHSVISQARTHRTGISFDCQSFRYTGKNFLKIESIEDVEEVIYFRPVGNYTDRQGHKYSYETWDRLADIHLAYDLICAYKNKILKGYSEEHARGMLPYDYRQHFVVSMNLRTALHFCDLRLKPNAQLEIQWFAQDVWEIIKAWVPEIAQWYEETRLMKGRLAP